MPNGFTQPLTGQDYDVIIDRYRELMHAENNPVMKRKLNCRMLDTMRRKEALDRRNDEEEWEWGAP